MTSQEIRKQFLDFFKSKQHTIVPSAPVVPFDDPTLLFTNAGMNQFKDVFTGTGSRDYSRAADTQKCIRVSGKHNDLEEVGHDTYHHTFFEMLGNWSFGDYYKEEAITWAWELLTEVWKLPKERLWATVYRTDDESLNLWKEKTDIDNSHILKFDEKDNFWEMGETGPCGPCSEIHINLSDDLENPELVNAGSEECIEIWNLVFIQYYRDETGTLNPLPAKHVDTGMGFERICAVLQNKKSNYDTDVFKPLIDRIASLSEKKYENENIIPMNVIADHIRTLTFAIADGAVPGNEGRGYVLRRILRRAARYGRKLDLNKPFLFDLVKILVETMGNVFPEIVQNQNNIIKIIKSEEVSFNATLDRGIELFEQIARKVTAENKNIIAGEDVFKLYDTFGFPPDLTNIMAREKNLSIDENKFNQLMNEQKQRARQSTKAKTSVVKINTDSLNDFDLNNCKETTFTGYNELKTEAKIVGLKQEENNLLVILDKSPFYVESGGQTSDKGILKIGDSKFEIQTVSKIENRIVHVIKNPSEKISPGNNAIAIVDYNYRWAIMRNHSATHLLHFELRKILGTHVKQSGSFVGADRLRFDFTHFEKISQETLFQIEKEINKKIRKNIPLNHHLAINFDKAKEMGALMFFGDKYGNKVNVVEFGESKEFCGGTHVKNTSQIGMFKIISESSISSGIRRIEAVTAEGVEKFIAEQTEKIKSAEIKISELQNEKKKLEKELAEFELKSKLGGLEDIISNPTNIGEIKLCKGKVSAVNMDELKSMGDELRSKLKSGIGILISAIDEKVGIVCVVTDDLIKDKKIMAGKIVGAVAKIVGGGGGGRPHMATAGGRDISKIEAALSAVDKIIEDLF